MWVPRRSFEYGIQHRHLVRGLIDECLTECRVRAADLDAVAVSTRPGLVIALKEGAYAALQLARYRSLDLYHKLA